MRKLVAWVPVIATVLAILVPRGTMLGLDPWLILGWMKATALSVLFISKVRLHRGSVGVEVHVEVSNGFVVWCSDNGRQGWTRKTRDDVFLRRAHRGFVVGAFERLG